MPTTIQISDNVRNILEKMKMFERESYNEVIVRMIEDERKLSKEALFELEKARKDPKIISHEEAKKRLGL
ncbi:antitoxin VapB family protein [Candidatus Pacearchaeota archaeon]|nr:antitoxin VapB family protein [Candidatus Pacearchaeota archaeon]